ncbi:MAG: Unknown protein [uncultured Sulfurovum sp.]|uniref:Uncharacterized protein n=1 Tax=uncultured Sulfurovum sp. TaxID=269237 RepID=A0A6S6T6T3_9BACT|nr:MAG: Unknown protein [uncultured Sulfurovum sp.]
MKKIEKILNYEIRENFGIGGDIVFGMKKEDFLTEYITQNDIESGDVEFSYENQFCDILGGVELFFSNKLNNILTGIRLYGNFKGKYLNKITIGTKFKELYELKRKEIHFDDDLFFIGQGYRFQVELDESEFPEEGSLNFLYFREKKVDKFKIEAIHLSLSDF